MSPLSSCLPQQPRHGVHRPINLDASTESREMHTASDRWASNEPFSSFEISSRSTFRNRLALSVGFFGDIALWRLGVLTRAVLSALYVMVAGSTRSA